MNALRRGTAVATSLIAVVMLGSATYARRHGDARETAPDVPARPAPGSATRTDSSAVGIAVQGAVVTRDTLTLTVTAAGEAAPARYAVLRARVAGRVTRLSVQENVRISAADVLVKVDAAEYELAVAEARAHLRQAETRYQELVLFDDHIGDDSLRAARSRAARVKSGLDAAEVSVRKSEFALRSATVMAPLSGVAANIRVAPGQWVAVGDELLTVVALDPIKLRVQVLESEVTNVSLGRRAQATFAAFPNRAFAGTVATINPVVDPDTRTAEVTVLVPNADRRILPGMYAQVALETRRLPGRLLVPRTAILERDRRRLLFVFEPDSQRDGRDGDAKWRYVSTGVSNDSLVEIVAGPDTDIVEAGEIVLTAGHHTLIHDARVRLDSVARDTRQQRQ